MKRAEVWWVRFGPSIGEEIQKTRPAVILSNDSANRFLNRVQVVPLTTQTSKVYPGEALVVLNNRQVKAMSDQIATVSKQRLIRLEGTVSDADMRLIERAVKIQLNLT